MQGLSPSPPRPAASVEIDADVPAYRVIEKRGFVDDSDILWPKGEMIYWEGEPNPGFEPLNEMAEERLREYFEKLDRLAVEVAEKRGSSHASLVNAFEARRRLQEMDRKLGRSVNREEEMPIMGARREGRRLARSVHMGAPTPILSSSQNRYPGVRQKAAEVKKESSGRGRPRSQLSATDTATDDGA